MWRRFLELVAPFQAIAMELKAIRELYEAELATHTPPIWRSTETPGDDTQVSYTGDQPKAKVSALSRLTEGWEQGDFTQHEEEEDE